VNADDFGQGPGVNRGIVAVHEQGIVTSASLMVRRPAAGDAALYGRSHPELSIGIHFELAEWKFCAGQWVLLDRVVPLEDSHAIVAELERQLETFRNLTGRDPTHVDSHQHVHLRDTLKPLFTRAASGIGVPLRQCSDMVHYCGSFYGQSSEGVPDPNRISVAGLTSTLSALPEGITELGCHPGFANDLEAMYSGERAVEVVTLCAPQIRRALEVFGIQLCSFHDVMRLSKQTPGRA